MYSKYTTDKLDEEMQKRFWSKVYKPHGEIDCWIWTGGTNGVGYGVAYRNGKAILAHRYSWEIKHGSIPDGLVIRHLCNNARCVNPHHLATGTQKQNMGDMLDKEPGARMRLGEECVREIRHKYEVEHIRVEDLAAEYEMHLITIRNVVNYRTYKTAGGLRNS